MRIDSVLPTINYPYGGLDNAVFNLAKEISKEHEIRLHTFNTTTEPKSIKIIPFSQGLPAKEITEHGLTIYRYSFSYFPFFKYLSLSLLKSIRTDSAQILHINGFQHPLMNALLCYATSNKKASVLTTHGMQEGLVKISQLPFSKIVSYIIVNVYLKKLDHIIALSETDRQSLESLGLNANKISVIPNGIDKGKFVNRDHFVKIDNSYKILSVGGISRRKRFDDLIKALNIVKDKLDFTAYIVGYIIDENYFKQLKRLISDFNLDNRVNICVAATNAQVTDCYLSADSFVLASDGETSPLVVMEAMYAGLPVIATRVGGVPDLIKDAYNGYLVDVGEPGQIADRILSVYENNDMRKSFSERNVELAQVFDWEVIAHETTEIYKKIYIARQSK